MENPLTPAGIEPATFRIVAQYLNHCATAVPKCIKSYCLFQRNTMKANGHVEVQLHTLLTSVLDGGVWLPPLPSRFIWRKDAPRTHQSLPRLRECLQVRSLVAIRCSGTHQAVDMRSRTEIRSAPRPHLLCAPAGTDSTSTPALRPSRH